MWDVRPDALGGVPTLTVALPLASELGAARGQMAFTLGFHIILASLGVALPAIMLIANYRGLRRDDADALLLARRWSKVVAVTFAVGAVTGTVLSFEFGLLWPAYILGWDRVTPWKHFWAGVPIPITGLGGTFSVVAVNSWMDQPPRSLMAER
jgi:cytochrome d ubiquinol oxidase subunit I